MGLNFTNINHTYDTAPILTGASFDAPSGRVTCLVGASGSGKTTLLRLAAGTLAPQSGEISLDGEVLANAQTCPPPEARDIGLVFQEGALFPHLSVAENIGFGLKDRSSRADRINEMMALTGLNAFANRRPHHLSGGQQQRVALARALAPAPRVLLLDEPFASLDARLRRELRQEVREILTASDVISILVTHDPEEAMETADQIVYLEKGGIVQAGAPETFFDTPHTPDIARIFCAANLTEGQLQGDQVLSPFGTWPRSRLEDPSLADGRVRLAIRPDDLRVIAAGEASSVIGHVIDARRIGAAWRIAGKTLNGERWSAQTMEAPSVSPGDEVGLDALPGSVMAFPHAPQGSAAS